MKALPVAVVCLLVFSFLTPAFAAIISSSTSAVIPTTSMTTTTINPCATTLCATLTPQNNTFNPRTVPNYFGTDLGKFSTVTDPQHFEWSTSANDFMLMSLPTVGASPVSNSLVYYNSTHTAYQFSGSYGSLSVFLKSPSKLSPYQVKISIHANLGSPQTVCFPFTASNQIVQDRITNKTTGATISLLPSIRAGNEVFDWGDIPQTYSPSWNFPTSAVCMSFPVGITNIDPLALDGSGSGSDNGALIGTVTLSTTTANDIIVIGITTYNNQRVSSISDGATLTWSNRAALEDGTSGHQTAEEWYAKSTGILTSDIITIHYAGGSFATFHAWGISGANFATPFDPNVSVPATKAVVNCGNSPSVSGVSTSNANDFLIAISGDDGGLGTLVVPTGFTKIFYNAPVSELFTAYNIVSATQSAITIAWTGNGGGGCNGYAVIADAIQQAVSNAPYLLTLIINPSPSPEGGAIFWCTGNPLNCNPASYQTISSTTTFTVAAGATTTYELIAQEFSAYIWNGWSGATTLVQDTINNYQTATLAATMTTTQSATLTANFSSGGSLAVPALVIGAILVGFIILAMIAARRR